MKTTGYLSFKRKERLGIISLMIVLISIAFLPELFSAAERDTSIIPEEKLALISHSTAGKDSASKKFDNSSKYPTYSNDRNDYVQRNRIRKQFEPPRRKQLQPFDINEADTAAFIALPGIGSKLASRIVAFRDKLGGFANVNQVGEVYGLHDTVFSKILPFLKCKGIAVSKLNINRAGKDDLKNHPYIRWKMAEALVAFRSEHGAFKSVEDIMRMENMDAASVEKLIPYLSFEE